MIAFSKCYVSFDIDLRIRSCVVRTRLLVENRTARGLHTNTSPSTVTRGRNGRKNRKRNYSEPKSFSGVRPSSGNNVSTFPRKLSRGFWNCFVLDSGERGQLNVTRGLFLFMAKPPVFFRPIRILKEITILTLSGRMQIDVHLLANLNVNIRLP